MISLCQAYAEGENDLRRTMDYEISRPALQKNVADHGLIFRSGFVSGKQKRELWQLSDHAEARSASSEKGELFRRDPRSGPGPHPASNSREDIVYIRHL
jgi:hypothetical protein